MRSPCSNQDLGFYLSIQAVPSFLWLNTFDFMVDDFRTRSFQQPVIEFQSADGVLSSFSANRKTFQIYFQIGKDTQIGRVLFGGNSQGFEHPRCQPAGTDLLAGKGLFIHHQAVQASLHEFTRTGCPCRAATDNHNLMFSHDTRQSGWRSPRRVKTTCQSWLDLDRNPPAELSR